MILQKLIQKIQYPKFCLLLISMFLAYVLFQHDIFKDIAMVLNSKGYASIFIAGLLFSYGFTTPFAIGFFATLAPTVSLVPAAFLAAVGAVFSDMLIFRFVRTSFTDELDKFRTTRFFQRISGVFHSNLSDRAKKYVLWTFAGFLIASPLPDEIGVSFISGMTTMNTTAFGMIAFCFNLLGILGILALSL